MAINLQALKDEITNNTESLPYPPFIAANDAAVADVGNNISNVAPRTVNQNAVDTGLIRGSIRKVAFQGLVTSEEEWFKWLTVNGSIPVTDDTLQELAGIPVAGDSIWSVGTRDEANAAMAKLMQRIGSRAEELKDIIGVSSWTPSNIADARTLP